MSQLNYQSAGGTLLYIGNHLSKKLRKDPSIFKPFELESTFIKICYPKKANIVTGCIYKHPNINLNEFNEYYLNDFLDKLSIENKTVLLFGDFNINF